MPARPSSRDRISMSLPDPDSIAICAISLVFCLFGHAVVDPGLAWFTLHLAACLLGFSILCFISGRLRELRWLPAGIFAGPSVRTSRRVAPRNLDRKHSQ